MLIVCIFQNKCGTLSQILQGIRTYGVKTNLLQLICDVFRFLNFNIFQILFNNQ